MARIVKITAVVLLLALYGSAWAFSGIGSGTEADPYIITNVEQLQEMNDDLNACYVLGNDIDASGTVSWNGGAGFEPIGTDTDSFYGTFDGQGHTVSSLYINRPSTDFVALFGCIRDGAELKNVNLVNFNITGYSDVGTLSGYSGGSTISNCSSSGTVTGVESGGINSRVGGLVGRSSGASVISQCYSTSNVTSGAWQVGGLSGYNGHGSVVINCYATGDVTGLHKAGGLVGDNCYPEGGYVKRCYSTGKVTGGGGGLIGYNFKGGVTYDSYWDKDTSGRSSSHGGTPKTTAQMMQQATFVNWDFDEVWYIKENQSYPILKCQISGDELIIIKFEDALGKKQKMLHVIDESLGYEQDAYEALEQMLESGDYGDWNKRDIIRAKQKAHSAMQHQEQAADALDKSIEGLCDTLTALGWDPEPEIVYEISDDCARVLSATEESGELRFRVTVEGQYIYFEDMMVANCCTDALELNMEVEDNLITAHEIEHTASHCWCICDYEVTATLGPFEPGIYTIEVYEDFGGFIGSTTVTIE